MLVLRTSNFQGTTISRYNPSNIFARARLVSMRHVTEYSPAKTGEYQSDVSQFSKPCVLPKNCLKDNKLNSLHLARK